MFDFERLFDHYDVCIFNLFLLFLTIDSIKLSSKERRKNLMLVYIDDYEIEVSIDDEQ